MDEPPPTPRGPATPPVGFGCFIAAALIGVVVFVAFLGLTFVDSGSNTGRIVLDPAGAYPPGTVTRVVDRGLYIVRLPTGEVLALGDLDAANRTTPERRCRVEPLAAGDPLIAETRAAHASAFSPAAAGLPYIFREGCNGALYDVTGARLDAEAPNLDRYPTEVNSEGRLTVNTARRLCTERHGEDVFAEAECPRDPLVGIPRTATPTARP